MFKNTQIKAISVLALLVLAIACQPEDDSPGGSVQVAHMSEMSISKSFNWSASLNGKLKVDFLNPDNISVERELVILENAQGQALEKARVKEGRAVFKVQMAANDDYKVFFPYTGERIDIKGPGTYQFSVSNQGSQSGKQANGGSCTVCNSPIENNLAESPAIPNKTFRIVNESTVPGWETTAPDNKIEIWSSGFRGVPAQEGRQFFEINANHHPNAALFQSLCLEPGSTIRWSVWHRARVGNDVARVKIGASTSTATQQAIMSSGTSAWNYYSGTYVVPANQTTTVFMFEAVSTGSGNSSVGNFLDNFRIECDEDGDGVADSDDDFPQDPAKAYREYYPSSGRHIVSFEDLWPATGDYDFNDLVLNQQVTISRDGNNDLVSADFKISIDAIGAGLRNGIALQLRKSDGSLFPNEKVSSFSGDVANDPANVNGFILSSDIFADISSYYQNNGDGPSKAPDTLSFTLNFNAGVTDDFYPELYLFRSDDRGLEVHLPAYPGSSAFNSSYQNTLDDNGNFRTADGLPWAIEIITAGNYQHPLEKIDMIDAFPQFQTWANSLGSQNQTWYDFPSAPKIFDPSN